MKTRIAFLGSKKLGLECLKTVRNLDCSSICVVVTVDDSNDSRSRFAELRDYSQQVDIPLEIAKSQKEAEDTVHRYMPDLCLVVGWYWLFSRQSLSVPPRGYLGIHNSLLPTYRGCAPLVWALMNGEKEVGISLFSFTEGMDDGPVWLQGRTSVSVEDDIGTVLARLESESVAMLKDNWCSIINSEIKPFVQNEAKATYCGLRMPSDGRINWDHPAWKVHDFIRAQTAPYPGAWTELPEGKRMTIWKTSLLTDTWFGTSGQVLRFFPDGVGVCCGENTCLKIMSVSVADASPVNARNVLNSLRIRM